jgi:cell division protein FtsA
VLTGGGAQVKHLKQLVEYITGMDTRIGYPNEHLAGGSDEALSSPSFATAVGLLMEGLEKQEKSEILENPDVEDGDGNQTLEAAEEESSDEAESKQRTQNSGMKKSIFEKFTERFREFLDNAE